MTRIVGVRFEIEVPDRPSQWEPSRLVAVNEETGERKTIISEVVTPGREWDFLTYRLEQGLREVSLSYD